MPKKIAYVPNFSVALARQQNIAKDTVVSRNSKEREIPHFEAKTAPV